MERTGGTDGDWLAVVELEVDETLEPLVDEDEVVEVVDEVDDEVADEDVPVATDDEVEAVAAFDVFTLFVEVEEAALTLDMPLEALRLEG